MRLNKVLRQLNISLDRAVEYLASKGHEIEARPTAKISGDVYQILLDGFETDANKKAASKEGGEEKSAKTARYLVIRIVRTFGGSGETLRPSYQQRRGRNRSTLFYSRPFDCPPVFHLGRGAATYPA